MLNHFKLAIKATRLTLSGERSNIELDYDNASGTYDSYYSRNLAECAQTLMERITVQPNVRVLDLACGTGYFSHKLASALGNDGHLDALDISEKMLEVNSAGARERGVHDKITYIKNDALGFLRECEANQYDMILCGWGICYMDHRRFFDACHRILKRGGTIGIIENTAQSLYEISAIFERVITKNPDFLAKLIKLSLPKDDVYLKKVMVKSGFHISEHWTGQKILGIHTAQEILDYMIFSGASAGYLDCIDPTVMDKFKNFFLTEVESELKAGNERELLIHRYCGAIGQK